MKLSPRELVVFFELWRALHVRPAAGAVLARRESTRKRSRATALEALGHDAPRSTTRRFKAERAANRSRK